MKGNRIVWGGRMILIVLIDDAVSGGSQLIGNLNHGIALFSFASSSHFLFFYINIFPYLVVLGGYMS